MKETVTISDEELADLEEYRRKEDRVMRIRVTSDGSSWTRAGGGWRKVSRQEARDD